MYTGMTEITVNVLKFGAIFSFFFVNKMLVFRAGIHKMLVSITNRENTDQTASELLLSVAAHIIALLHVGLINVVYLTACALLGHHDVAVFE